MTPLTALTDLDDAIENPGHPAVPQLYDPEVFFAESPADVEYAKSLCQTCPLARGLPRRRQGPSRAVGRLGRRALRPGRRRGPQAPPWPPAQEPGRRMSLPARSTSPSRTTPRSRTGRCTTRSPEPAGSALPARTTSGAITSRQNRNLEMQLIPEVLARAHMHEGRAVRLAAARRVQRRAERARCAPDGHWPGLMQH
ncbi:hypothetical protein GCM10020221_26500 [Streptomyces thioluteus]|uniref:4Fe-4S Wbl-type domain-containing protein n=1 Tax=Streptomyces thioluteus TaxID=66431 RepID=A0ABN3WWD4_STRTU